MNVVRPAAEMAASERAVGLEGRTRMENGRSLFYRFRHYAITTFRDGGGWCAKARVAKIPGGDRAVAGGPWRSAAEAKAAAEAFCNRGKAG